MSLSKRSIDVSTITPKHGASTRKAPARRAAKVTPSPALPSESTTPRRARQPRCCTTGHTHYDERRGEQVIGRAVPKLRFSGRWLEPCGFAVGDALQVMVGNGLLLISRSKG